MAQPTFTVLALRNRARRESGVSVNDYSNASILEDLNQAYVQLAGLLANIDEGYFREDKTKFSLALNSSLYSLPTDFLALRGVRLAYSGSPAAPGDYRISTPYDPAETHNASADEESVPTANPIHDITGTYIRIKPTPTRAVTNGGLLYYVAMPSALANTGDIPVLPVQYQSLLADYSAKNMTFKYEKWSKNDRLEKRWNETISELMQVLADRDRGKAVRMKSVLEIGPAARLVRRELG